MTWLANLNWEEYRAGRPVAGLDGMHLWAIRASDENASHQSEEESFRSLSIKDEKVRLDYSVAQGGLRRILSAYCDETPKQIAIQRTIHGKPYVKDGPEFNLSHTRSQMFVIVSRQPVGLDVEAADRPVRAQELVRKFFSKAEQGIFRDLNDREANDLLLRLWVCKEAMVKLSGDGVYYGLRDAHVFLSGDRVTGGEYRGRAVHLWPFQPAPGFLAAVASWQKEEVKCFFRL